MNNTLKTAIRNLRNDSPVQFICRILWLIILGYVRLIRWFKIKIIRLEIKNKYVVKEIQGNKMYLSLKDPGISSDLLVDGVKEPLATEMIKKMIKEGDVIVDIGANIGYYALLESRLAGSTGKIFAIEPIIENVELLKKNIALNKYFNIEMFQLAIGNENKNSSIFLSDKSNCASLIFHKNVTVVNRNIKKVPTTIKTLDEFLKDKPMPNLIRMDVEGYEFEIIQGMKNLLRQKSPLKIFIEVHPAFLGEEKLIKMLDILKNYGFYCGFVTDKDLYSKSYLLQKFFYFLSHKINKNSQNGYLYQNSSLDNLKEFRSQEIFPKVLFKRD